ncbi:hypothetical protein GJAV_G00067920 [Gymnothorax javanicus]|nr:hypothetical protein GJAV_G00067920 [Gymnothorax javanicus]
MSLINTDEDQRWVPTHVQVTVLRARGLRAKGKNGTSDVYTIIQVGKEKYSTCVVEKTTAPEWKEECSFELLPGVLEAEGRSAYPAGSCDLVLTVMHRALIGLDVFLGQATIPLDTVFQERLCTRNEWYKLNSKTGKKEKERGEVQVTVQFTRNNLTASMYDLSVKDKPFSAFSRLKDRMKGKKREDVESASAIVPGGFGAQGRRRTRLPSDGGGEEDYEDDEGGEVRRSKMRNFFLRGKLRKSSDTRSSTSLGSESSESSSRGGSLSPTAGISVVVSDLSNSPSETSNLTADNSPEHTAYPSPRLSSHKRAFSDEVGLISLAPPLPPPPPPPQPRVVESLKREGVLSQSEGDSSRTPAALGLLQKCAPLSRSLQNLARRPDDSPRLPPASEARRWSFDKAAKEEKAADVAVALQPPEQKPTLAAALVVPAATVVAEVGEAVAEGKKQKRNLFSSGKGVEPGQAPPSSEEGGKIKGWFSSKDPHNKPSSLLWPTTAPSSSPSSDLNPAENYSKMEPDLVVGLAQEKPHLGGLGTKARASPNPFIDSPLSENLNSEWDESFEAFAASRLGSLRGSAPLRNLKSLLEPTASQALEGLQITQKNTEAETGSPLLLQRPSKIPILQGRQSPMFDWTLEPDLKTDLFPPPQIGVLPAEHSMVDLSGHTPTPSQTDKGATSPLWEWDPEEPLDILLSSPQFVNMSSVIPESASSGQPIVSPFGKDPTETRGGGPVWTVLEALPKSKTPLIPQPQSPMLLKGSEEKVPSLGTFPIEGTPLESVPDISADAPELPPEKLDEVPAGSPVQVDKEDEVLLEGDGLEHEEPCAEETLRKEGSDSLPGGKATVSPKPSVVSLTEETSDGILNEDTFASDALGTDSDYRALDADPENAHQEICEENANISVKESSGGSTLSDYLEARDPGPSISPVAEALDFVTAIEVPDPGSICESHDAPSAEMELNQLPLQCHFDEMAAPVEAGEITPSPFGAEDPSSDAVEQGVQPENLLSDFDSSEPSPEPPRLFQDSVFDESHRPNLGEEHSDTPRDSPVDLFQTPEVGSGPESQQTSSFPLGTTVASEDRWQKISSETPNTTYPLTEDDLSTHKPEVSLAEPNKFFVPITLPSFSETPLEGLSSTDALKPEYEVTSNPMISNTNVVFPPVMTEAGHENICESQANVFDFANSVLPDTDAASSLSVTMANNTEINSNSTNDLFTSPSLFDQEEIMNEKNSKKPEDLFSDILEDSSLAEVADQPVKADPPLSFSSEGTPLESVPDISADAPELPPEKLDEVPAGSPVQVDKEDEVLLEGDGLEHEEPCAEETLRKEGSDSLPGGKATVSPKPSVVSLTEETSDGILNEDTFASDALGTDSDYRALDADPEDAHQEIYDEENANITVKEPSGGSTLSDYLEARDPGPWISPVAEALDFVTAIEDPDPGSICESHDAPSAEMELNQLPLQSHFDEMAAPVEAGEIAPSPFGAEDPSLDAVEQGVQPENLLSDYDSSEPPPEPPRLFQDSVFDKSHRPNLGEEHSDTPRDSPADFFQTPEVGSGPESQQTSSFPLGTTAAPEDRWQKISLETPNTTYALTEDELLTGKQEVAQFDFSAFGIEETSNQSWLTGKDNFKVKELDTTNFAAWSADEELAIQMDSRSSDKAILMETTAESESAPVLGNGIQPNPTNGFCLPGPKDDDGLWGSYLDPLKVAKPEEGVEPTWQSLPSLSELCSTVSQDLVTDMAPEDLRKPQDEEEAQKASSELPLEPVLFPRSDLFSGTDLSALPKGSDSVSDLLKGTSSEAEPALWSRPPFGEKPKSSVFLHDCNPQASSTPSLLAETNALVDFFPSPIQLDPATGATPEASSVAPSSDPPAMIDALLMLLPQETQPTTSLLSTQQSSPHPVKPLNATAPQEEKKPEGRSVLASRLEKLKSTIHPGRAAQLGESEANRDEALAEGAASYYHMSHSELITLLLQREAELERQGSEFERQGALLEKREAELRKMKVQTRDLEDYIDRLLVQIMEQKPNLLQVRTKLK